MGAALAVTAMAMVAAMAMAERMVRSIGKVPPQVVRGNAISLSVAWGFFDAT